MNLGTSKLMQPETETDALPLAAEQEREKMHRQILSSVSHDLKTPLVSIIGSLEVFDRMNDRLSVEQRQRLITVALQEAYRLDTFITNILDMAKLENGMVRVRLETVDMRMMIGDCVAGLGARLNNSKVEIEAVGGLKQVSVDTALLARALCLLIDNAVKYGGSPPVIHIAFGKNAAGQGFVSVADNGSGIPPGCMESIFSKYTRFARGDQQSAGFGLGLAICREIMRLLQGNVVAENGPDGGAVFTLFFAPA